MKKLMAMDRKEAPHQIKNRTTKHTTGIFFINPTKGRNSSSNNGTTLLTAARSIPKESPKRKPALMRRSVVPATRQKSELPKFSINACAVSMGVANRMGL